MVASILLDINRVPAKNTANYAPTSGRLGPRIQPPESMTVPRAPQPPENKIATAKCKHPSVRIVAREEDSEFVECLECGEVFESSEFKDMDIEESKQLEVEEG